MAPRTTPGHLHNAHVLRRRSVLATGLGLPFFVPRHVLGGAGHKAPSDTLAIAAVGIGGMGANYLRGCENERIVSLCDLDHNLAGRTFDRYSSATRYHDYRRMFDKEAPNFDALIIATPDHTHAPILAAAIRLGKHVYCAKPITHTVHEARTIRKMLAENPNLITKSSVQSSATDEAHSTTELLATGAIGPIDELHIWCDHPAYPCSLTRPTETQTPPPGMDWDLWLGPAPERPYHAAYHPSNWRPWWDFGSGTVGDMACHTLHVYFRHLKLGSPTSIHACASTRHKGFFQQVSTPECQSHANMVTWEFPARDGLRPLTVHWYDGGMKPHRPHELDPSTELPESGLLFSGENGKLLAGYSGGNPFGRRKGLPGGLLLPEGKFKDFPQPAKTLPRCDHYREWTENCKTGRKTACPIAFGCEMTEMALLGAIALRTRRFLQWDATNARITNSKQAEALVNPPYREPWTL